MEQTKRRKVLGSIMRMIFFLVLFCAFLGLYHSPFSYFNNSYGLLKGPGEPVMVRNLMDAWDFVYIRCINCLYLFLGEKPGVVIGYHIFLRMINCLLLFFSVEKIGKPALSGFFTLLYGIYPFVIYELYNYDGIIVAEFFCILLLFLASSLIKVVISATLTGRRQKDAVSNGGVSPQWETENQMPRQAAFQQEGLAEADVGKYSFGFETEKALQVKKTGEQMRQDGVMAGNMEKEKVVKERDGIPNFLELTDEEIRRNAMIAAGLLSPEEETKPETEERGATKKKAKKKSKDKGEKKPLFRKNREPSVKTKAIEQAEASKVDEWAGRQGKQADMEFKQPDIMPEQSDTGAKTSNRKSEPSNTETGQPSMSHTQFIENPLPVPKRHVKKEMDYEYQVPEEKMHYDIEEPDKNYFDVV